ncbi:NAD(P)/FAD-dependent oxidoreductase [Psychrobacillus sp. L3]|uniref:NAD(P)/FAD-dependent oxidoreductase n=1 Tax=Psychrobacillus sp. L3 TaxID=3236891 RepID=UPI0036F2D2F9
MDLLSMWEATANQRPKYEILQGDQHCDVVIIGGGYSGLSTSYHLQEKGFNTIILEKGKVGGGASGRNGGQVLTGYLGSMEYWAKKKGLKAAKQMWEMSLSSIDLIENIIEKNSISCDFKRNGDFFAAYKPSHLEAMKRDQEFMASELDYHEIKVIEKADLQDEMNTTIYHGGRVDAKSAHFHPLNYVLGLAEAAEKFGAQIYEHSEAFSIVKNGNGKKIANTKHGRVFADHVVIVTNAYSGDLNETIKKSVVPIESIMISTEPLPEELIKDLIKNDRAVFDSKELLYYFRRTADNRLAFGGSGRSSSKRDQNSLYDNLRKGMVNVFPQLEEARIEYQWSGKVAFTKDMLPYIGKMEDGTHYAFGYGGHGAAMSSLLGKLIAENISDESESDNPLRIEKLRPIPFHSQNATGVGVIKVYKQFKDRFLK